MELALHRKETAGREQRQSGRARTAAVILTAGALFVGGMSLDRAAPVAAADELTSNVVTRWVEQSMRAVRTGSPAIHTGTPGAGRTYAMTTVAMYDAVNGIDVASGVSTRSPAILAAYAGAPSGADREAAASGAAHAVLRSLFSANAAVVNAVDTAFAAELASRWGGRNRRGRCVVGLVSWRGGARDSSCGRVAGSRHAPRW